MEMHRLLQRQVQKYLGNQQISNEMQKFISAVNLAYIDYENDRRLMERSIEISSKEYHESLEKIQKLQVQLIQQEKMAGIGQLSAGIAHEINNPLGYIQSNMETLKIYMSKTKSFFEVVKETLLLTEQDRNDEKSLRVTEARKKHKIDFIFADLDDVINESLKGLARIDKIVKSLLGFARKGMVSEVVLYDLNQGIKDTLTVANNEIKYHAKVIEELGDIPMVMVADDTMNQVLLNLIINAVHAIKEKEVKGSILIRTYVEDQYVVCSIADNGIGIPEKNLQSIFDPFFTTKPVGTGTGLGLSIAHNIIVNKHAGKFEVESQVGEGATFRIFIPINKREL